MTMKKVREKIDTPAVGEILTEEYLEPQGITAYRLANEIGVSTTTVTVVQPNHLFFSIALLGGDMSSCHESRKNRV